VTTKVETLGFKDNGVVVRTPVSEVVFKQGDARFSYGGQNFFVPGGHIWTLFSETAKPRTHHVIYEDVNNYAVEKKED